MWCDAERELTYCMRMGTTDRPWCAAFGQRSPKEPLPCSWAEGTKFRPTPFCINRVSATITMLPKAKAKKGEAPEVTGVRIPKVEEHETVPHPQESEVQKRQEEEEKAYLGRAKLDILKEPPGVKFRWGTWNKRRPVDSSVKKLVKSYQTEGKHPNRAPILLRVKLEDLVEGSYAKKTEEVVAWEDLPELKFKARVDASEKEGNTAKVQNKLGGEGSERQQDDLDGLQKAINVLHVKIETAGHWCVHIYIEGCKVGGDYG
ncbi:hypothetical protein LXA43DRAFT_1070080 [Ganoderma leucocontextum]|nr:hypothetical protein LXA43DRAFT_1070080 [Ganoderma leucocontextum]